MAEEHDASVARPVRPLESVDVGALLARVLAFPLAVERHVAPSGAGLLGLKDRGALVKGYLADIVVFDPDLIQDMSTFEDPFHYPTGMRYVIVNGTAVVDEGKYTGALPGRALRGPAYIIK